MPANPDISQIEIRQDVQSGISTATWLAWARAARRKLPARRGQLSISIVGPQAMRRLNRAWRGKDRPTNVLSWLWPADDLAAPVGGRVWGEILLCPSVIRREARQQGRSYRQYARYILHHGLIHLLGLDHQTRVEQAHWDSIDQRLPL